MLRKVPSTLFLLVAILASLVPGALAQGPVPPEPAPQPRVPAGPDAPAGTLVPPPSGITAVTNGYTFASELGAYAAITGGTQLSADCDDEGFQSLPIGFDFVFDTITYTQFSVQCNGFVAMGPWVYSTYDPISSGSSSDHVISALGDDLQAGTANSALSYELLGSAPERILVVQWKNFRAYEGSQTYNFQIRLHETSNVVEVVYGPFVEDDWGGPQVGLRGDSNADFHNRTTDHDTHYWANSLRGLNNSDEMYLEEGIVPPAGLTYSWTPRAPGPNYETSRKEATAQIATGDLVTYTIWITNTGEFTGSGTLMTDTLAAGTTYYSGTPAWCSSGSCGYDAGSNSVLWTGDLAVGEGVQIAFVVDTDNAPCGSILNSAAIVHPATGNTGRADAWTQSVLTPPVAEYGFDSPTWPPDGWSIYDRDGITEATWISDTAEPHGGTGAAYHDYYYPDMQDGWLVTPRFTVTPGMRLTFWQRDSYDPGEYYFTHSVQLTTDPSPDPDLSAYTPIWSGDTTATYTWEQASVDLADYAGQAVYVAFRYEGADGDDWYIDDVALLDSWYPCPAAAVGPSRSGAACLGTTSTHALTVWTSYLTETFDLEAAGASWPSAVLPSSVTVPWGGQAPVSVTVTVPWDAAAWTADTVTITASGRDSGLGGQAAVTTRAVATGWDVQWRDQPADQSVFWAASYYEHGNVCIVGGGSGDFWNAAVLDTHRCYDIDEGTWFSRAPLPTPVFAPAYGLIHGQFYVAGGFYDLYWNSTNQLQIYDLTTDTWDTTTGALLPSARGGQASGVLDGRLYSAGGGGRYSQDDCPTYEYDPQANAWTTRASCPVQDGEGFYLGGGVSSTYHHRLFAGGHMYGYPGWFAYDPAADAWQQLASMPVAVTFSPLMVEDPTTGVLYQIGGVDGSDWPYVPHDDVRSYDYLANTWSDDPPDLPAALGGASGPPQGSFVHPTVQGFWAIGGMDTATSLLGFTLWQHMVCPPVVPDIAVAPAGLSPSQCANVVATQTLALCNGGIAPLDWTAGEVTATRTLVAADPAAAIPWLAVSPPSGTVWMGECATVTVAYDTAGLAQGHYTAGLAVASNDPDTPLLTVPISLTVLSPAATIAAPPLAAELCPGLTATLAFGICSLECRLDWTLAEVGGLPLQRPARTLALPAMPATAGPPFRADAPARGPRQVTVAGGPYFPTVYQVLVLSPDSSRGDLSLLLQTLAAYPELAVTVWDNAGGSPSAADLAPYDVVLFGNYATWESAGLDRASIGDALAGYIDGGGSAIESEFAQSYDAWGLAGRYVAGGYSPFFTATLDFPGLTDTLEIVLPDHPVMQGVSAIDDHRYQQNPGLRPGAELLASWTTTGNHAVAANENVVALNMVLFHTADWSGDVGTLLHNAVAWLAYQHIPWLDADPIRGSVYGGECVTVTVTLDATGLATGTYSAGLLVDSSDQNAPPTTLPVTLTVGEPAAASFAYAPQAGYPALTVHFTDTSANASDPTWSFGDGGTGAGATVSHTYTATGDYTVTLAVQSPRGCGQDTAAAQVRVVAPGAPLAGFASSAPDCLGDTTVFTNTTVGTGTITYLWAFGDGITSGEVHPVHLYTEAGTHTVVLTATNAAGQWSTAGDAVFIAAEPAAAFTYTVDGLEVAFFDGSTGATALLWAFGDGTTSNEANPLHRYAEAGSYAVTLTATNACGDSVSTAVVTTGLPAHRIYLPIVVKSWLP